MTYRIEGAQGVKLTAKNAQEALARAKATAQKFPPIRIFGPEGEVTLSDLRKLVDRGSDA